MYFPLEPLFLQDHLYKKIQQYNKKEWKIVKESN